MPALPSAPLAWSHGNVAQRDVTPFDQKTAPQGTAAAELSAIGGVAMADTQVLNKHRYGLAPVPLAISKTRVVAAPSMMVFA